MQKNLSIKIAIISFICLFLLVPLNMISGKISERAQFLTQAKMSVSQSWTGKQTIMSALIVIPYEIDQPISLIDKITQKKTLHINKITKHKFIIADQINITASINNDLRHKGIYKIPVYTATLDVSGKITQQTLQTTLKQIQQEENNPIIGRAYFSIAISDPRGINSLPTLQWQDTKLPFNAGSKLTKQNKGLHSYLPKLNYNLTEPLIFKYQLALRGMEAISFITAGNEMSVNVSSLWPHPQFIGSFLPIARTVYDNGYQANWKITSLASNIYEKINQCANGSCEPLFNSHFGIKHIEAVDIYLQAERSVKYGMLFIGLSFLTFFIFEVMMKLPIHPIQYTLVGFAIATFYLLLVSLSEHINFLLAYLIATICCTSLLFTYLRYMLASYKKALLFSALLLILYAVLYIIISAEDFALVMGAFLTFVSLAIIMITTRNINWYKVGEQQGKQEIVINTEQNK